MNPEHTIGLADLPSDCLYECLGFVIEAPASGARSTATSTSPRLAFSEVFTTRTVCKMWSNIIDKLTAPVKIADLALLSDPDIYSSLKVDYSKRVEFEQLEKVSVNTQSCPETGVGSGYQAALNEYQQCYRQNGDNWKIRCASVAEIPHDLSADQSKLQRASRAFQYIATHMLWEKFPFVLRTMLSSLTLPSGGSAPPSALRNGLIRSSDNIPNTSNQNNNGGEQPEMEISISSCQTIAKSRPSIVRELSRNDSIIVPEIAAAIGEAGVFGMSEPTDSICRQLSPSYARADKKNLWIMQVEHHQNESDGSLVGTNRFGPQFVCLIDSSVPRALAVEFCR